MPDMRSRYTASYPDTTVKRSSRQPHLRRSRSHVETSDWEKQKLAAEILDTLGDQSVDRVAAIMERLDHDSDLRSMATAVGGKALAQHMMLEEHYLATRVKAGTRSYGPTSATASRPRGHRSRGHTSCRREPAVTRRRWRHA